METVVISLPITNSTELSSEQYASLMKSGLTELVKIGALKGELDDILVDYSIDNGNIDMTINKEALVDPSKLSQNGSKLSFNMTIAHSITDIDDTKLFSVSTIAERLRIGKLNPKIKFRTILIDYKRFYRMKKSALAKDPALAKRLKDMFILDMMGIFNEILPYIEEGKQLSSLTGLNSITEGMVSVSRDLSLAYKRALKQAKGGQISKAIFTNLQRKYSEFMNLLVPQVFPDIDQVINNTAPVSGVNQTRAHSETVIGRLVVMTNNPDQLSNLIEKIQSGQGSKIKIDITTKEKIDSIELSPDLEITSISADKAISSNYSIAEDGRINIF